MKFSLRKVAAVAMAAGAVFAMTVGSASAAPVFTINPNAIPGNVFPSVGAFDATVFGGTSSELLHLNATGNSGNGWAQLTTASNGAAVVSPFVTGLAGEYNLYIKFFLDVTLVSGVNGAADSKYLINTLNFSVWADPDMNTSFTLADAATKTEAAVGGTTSDDIFLAFGSLVPGAGSADLTALGGAALNAINNFAVCTSNGMASAGGIPVANPLCTSGVGAAFFSKPDPFYQLAFSGFNNASGGVHLSDDGTVVAVQDAVAAITFNNVPEPGSLALLGIGLAGLGASARRRKTAK